MPRVKRELDAVDLEILRILSEDCREKLEDMAAKVGLSAPMVRRRIEALERIGILRGCRASVDLSLISGSSSRMVIMRGWLSKELLEDLKSVRAVERIYVSKHGGAAVAILRIFDEAEAEEIRRLLEKRGVEHTIAELGEVYESTRIPEKPGTEIAYRCSFCGGVIIGTPYTSNIEGRVRTFHGKECAEAYMQKRSLYRAVDSSLA